jgi:hypothetical protein
MLGAAALRAAARTFQRVADALAGPPLTQRPAAIADGVETQPPRQVWPEPAGPPEHWLRLVAEHAPGLLRDLQPAPTDPEHPQAIAQSPLLSPAAIHPAPARPEPLPGARPSVAHAPADTLPAIASGARTPEEEREDHEPHGSAGVEPVALPRARVSRGLLSRVRAALRPRAQSDPGRFPAVVHPGRETEPAPAAWPWIGSAQPPQPSRDWDRPPAADPWPRLPAATASTGAPGPARLPASWPAGSPAPQVPARYAGADLGSATRPASRPQPTVTEPPELPSSPWPDLPDDAEVWRIPEMPFPADRLARLAREQAGG